MKRMSILGVLALTFMVIAFSTTGCSSSEDDTQNVDEWGSMGLKLSTLDITHVSNGLQTFGKSTTLDVSSQWSTSFGVGLQYQIAPHVGFFVEPSLQYFIPDGSTIQSYRTEHPLQITLPLGIRFNW